MAATYVTQAQLRSALSIGSLYDNSTLEACCQAAEDLIKKQLWFNEYPVIGSVMYQKAATLILSATPTFATGQSVTVTNCGSAYNGTFTITGTYPWTSGSVTFPFFAFYPFNTYNFPFGYSMIQYNVGGSPADEMYHLIVPYGKVSGTSTGVDYATEPLVNEASLMVAIDIWQARQQSNAGGVSPDFTPSPYRMGNSLLSRVRGLLAPYLAPRGMVG